MYNYDELKSKTNILLVGNELGYNGNKTGSCYQGTCPQHASKSGKCLVIWPRTQSFKCFDCGESGDVIELIQLFRKCDHVTAVNFLADKVEMPHLYSKELSPEEQSQMEADAKEKMLVENMLSEAADFYHAQLANYPDIKKYLNDHYGFSDEIIEELKIGYAPHDDDTALVNHLNGVEEFKENIQLTGLTVFYDGSQHDYLRGRIVFPYWKHGKVVYMGARATEHTPVNQYECYTDKDGNVKHDKNGKPEYIKYKKLRSHDPDNPGKKNISRFIQNDTFLGEDSIRGAKEVIITEGIPDVISAIDKGFAALSPATVKFRRDDFEKLKDLTKHADTVYLINDNEENNAGKKGAIETGKYLTEAGKTVFLVELPRPEGKDKIDLNEYLKEHTKDDLQNLMDKAPSVLELMINELPDNTLRASPVIKSDIAPILTNLDEISRGHFVELLKKKLGTSSKIIEGIIAQAQREKEEEENQIKVDPEIEERAKVLANDPQVFERRIDTVSNLGIVGEQTNIAMYFTAFDSRLLIGNKGSSEVISVKNAGHTGSGKSHPLEKCMYIYPKSAYHFITSGSPKSLYHMTEGLSHRVLIVAEGFGFQKNKADSELLYAVRTLLTEGRIVYQVSEKDESGNIRTVNKIIEGPTPLVTTTTMDFLEEQLEDRILTIHPDESVEQTKRINQMTGKQMAGHDNAVDEKEVLVWKTFHSMLKPVKVVVPFGPKISDYINKNKKLPISSRRALRKIGMVIKAVTCCHQFQREKDKEGRTISEISDYRIGTQIVLQAFRENMGAQSAKTQQRMTYVQDKKLIKMKDLVKEFNVSSAAVSTWVKSMVGEGNLIWVDEQGEEFSNEKAERKAKRSGKGFIKVPDSYEKSDPLGLPSPYELTKDPKWDEGGELYEKYDLKLDSSEVKSTSTPKPENADTLKRKSNTDGNSDNVKSDAQKEDKVVPIIGLATDENTDCGEDTGGSEGDKGNGSGEEELPDDDPSTETEWEDSPMIDDKERERRKRLADDGIEMF